MISYGTINFEELEMKKYTGNVSFILNINSRCNSFQRKCDLEYKTREAVKECLSQLRKR
jgi:glutathione peroxidase-family protein